ncbi:MAG: hypothetical protein WC985_06570 [Thermoplasmata archaeon]
MSDATLAAILSTLAKWSEQSFEPSDFDKRLRIQKSIYLLKAQGYGPASKYSFGSYLRGPYSPDLARDYYKLQPGAVAQAPQAEMPRKALSLLVDALKRGNDFLETAATIRLYSERNRGSKKAEILEHVRYQKPALDPRLEEAWEFLEKYGLLPGYM